MYKDFDNTLKIQSVYPSEVVGAMELWAYNIKSKQLTVFRAKSNTKGLSVHRTSISEYDEATSVSKSVRANKVDSVLKDLQSVGKVALRKFMETVPGTEKDKVQHRMSDETLLIRVTKK